MSPLVWVLETETMSFAKATNTFQHQAISQSLTYSILLNRLCGGWFAQEKVDASVLSIVKTVRLQYSQFIKDVLGYTPMKIEKYPYFVKWLFLNPSFPFPVLINGVDWTQAMTVLHLLFYTTILYIHVLVLSLSLSSFNSISTSYHK